MQDTVRGRVDWNEGNVGEVQGQSPLSGDNDLLVSLLMDPQYSALCDSQAIHIS